jgi:hypothetical protein
VFLHILAIALWESARFSLSKRCSQYSSYTATSGFHPVMDVLHFQMMAVWWVSPKWCWTTPYQKFYVCISKHIRFLLGVLLIRFWEICDSQGRNTSIIFLGLSFEDKKFIFPKIIIYASCPSLLPLLPPINVHKPTYESSLGGHKHYFWSDHNQNNSKVAKNDCRSKILISSAKILTFSVTYTTPVPSVTHRNQN